MPRYQFQIGDIQVGACGVAALVLTTNEPSASLHVRLTPLEAQALVVELARLSTGRTRLAGLIGQLLQHADATNAQVQLARGNGSMVEAALITVLGAMPLTMPLAFSDAVVLARTLSLPLVGDESLEPLLRPAAVAEPEEILPSAITMFLDTLPGFSA